MQAGSADYNFVVRGANISACMSCIATLRFEVDAERVEGTKWQAWMDEDCQELVGRDDGRGSMSGPTFN